MKQACATGGTGWPFFEFSIDEKNASTEAKLSTESAQLTKKKISVGCKTGTAESHAESGKPHAWFTIFAPFEKPEIALSVLVEEGGQGSDVAAPIAKEILKSYFERKE
jgi:cell division protein FtsI/penicillin-binding protein 2